MMYTIVSSQMALRVGSILCYCLAWKVYTSTKAGGPAGYELVEKVEPADNWKEQYTEGHDGS